MSFMKRIHSYLSNIHLVDKCLLLFMLILLLQSAYSLFGLPISNGEGHTIDVIVRTSISAIFGYFLSAHFIQNDASKSKSKNNAGVSSQSIEDNNDENMQTKEEETVKPATSRLQILVATSIGLFCLIMLILVRDLYPDKLLDTAGSSFAATISQFRDLVSGCVGFLIGCPTTVKNQKKEN